MKSNKAFVAISVVLVTACLWACMIIISPFTIFGATDPFYRHGDDFFDVDLNFPLIKPYYVAGYPSGFPRNNDFSKYKWQIDLDGGNNSKVGWYDHICCIIKIAVENDIIFVYAPNQKQFDSNLHQAVYSWFVIKPKNLEELGFEDQMKFEEYLRNNRIDKPKWQEPGYLHDEFNMTGCLNWYPNCRKLPPIFRFSPSLFEIY